MIDEKHQKWIRKKFPIFFTIKPNLQDEFSPSELDSLETDLIANRQQILSKKNQKTFKKLKKLASESQKEYKSNKELYNLLSSVNEEQINEITLGHKKIQCLKPLEKRKLLKLSEIDLSFNVIKDIFPLTTSELPSLTYFNLSKNLVNQAQNELKGLKGLHECNWPKLKILNLSNNQITSIEPLSNSELVSLQKLDLSQNFITKIQSFQKSSSWELKLLSFKNNKVASLKKVQRLCFMKISELNLSGNPILNAVDIEKLQMTTLKNKKSFPQEEKSYILQKENELIQYSCKLYYSEILEKYKKQDLLLDFLEQKKEKNPLNCSKHAKYAVISAYRSSEIKIPIITTRKLHLN